MTTESTPSQESTDCPPPDPDPGCDPKLISDLACKSEGVAAQAEYNKTYQEALAQAQADFDNARKAYRSARQAASLEVNDLRHQIKHLIERIKCLIEQKRVIKCLDDAYCEIDEELKACEPKSGCCVGECSFETDDLETLPYEELVKRIADYQLHGDAAKACFMTLVGEPAALTKRVADVKAATDAINTALSADPASTDLKRVYAQAKVAARAVANVWAGFDETQDYVDCLCKALTCWTMACDAVSILTGAKAVADCKREAWEARCEKLRTNTVDEILARYDKLCPPRACEEENGPKGGEHEQEHEGCSECGGDHHHHEHHHQEQGGGGKGEYQQS